MLMVEMFLFLQYKERQSLKVGRIISYQRSRHVLTSGYLALEALQALTVEEPPDVYSTPSQLGGDLITLTLLPRARWQTLLNLDVIQVGISSCLSSRLVSYEFCLATEQTERASEAS